MRRNPVYVFKDGTSIGIFDIPLESIVHVIDSDGMGTPSMTQLIDKSLLFNEITIDQYLGLPTSHVELDRYIDQLNEISDVNITSLVVGDVLQFDGNSWINEDITSIAQNINLGDLNDVPYPVMGNSGQYLEYNYSIKSWVYKSPVREINDLNDVTTNPQPDQILAFNGNTNEWNAVNIDGGAF